MIVNGISFRTECLLGRGKSGYSYLATAPDGSKVVIKQIHHEPCDYYEFGDKLAAEVEAFQFLYDLRVPMPMLLQVDRTTERLVKEYIDGPTIFELVEHDAVPHAAVQQLRQLCCTLYAAAVNIDYFPTNFIWNEGQLYYVDYEYNQYSDRWNFENWGELYWSRTPEFEAHANRLKSDNEKGGCNV